MKISRCMAFCGITCALSTVILLASVFPYVSFGLAALAGLTLVPAALETKTRYGWLCYAVTSLLAVLLVPDQNVKWMFVLFLGYYPLLQLRIDLWQQRPLTWIVKLLIFNAACIVGWLFAVRVLGWDTTDWIIRDIPVVAVLFPVLNIVFVVYDVALRSAVVFYRIRIHPFVRRFL